MQSFQGIFNGWNLAATFVDHIPDVLAVNLDSPVSRVQGLYMCFKHLISFVLLLNILQDSSFLNQIRKTTTPINRDEGNYELPHAYDDVIKRHRY